MPLDVHICSSISVQIEFAIILYKLSVSFKEKMEAKHKDIFEHSVISSYLDLFNEGIY